MKTGKQKVTKPAFSLTKFLEERKNQEAYTVFFEHFVPCVTKKTVWDICLEKAERNNRQSRLTPLCSVRDEAFVLLLLETSFKRLVGSVFKPQRPCNATTRRKTT